MDIPNDSPSTSTTLDNFRVPKKQKNSRIEKKTQVVKSFKVIPKDYPIDNITDTGAAKMDAKTTSERKKILEMIQLLIKN